MPDDGLSCRNCELRTALEFGDPGTIAFLGKLVAQGASKLAVLTEDVPMPGVGVLTALNNHAEVDAKRRCLEGKSKLPSMVGNQVDLSGCGIMVQSTRVVRSVHSRYGLRGSRVGEASNPGPRAMRRRRVVASDTELDPELTMLDDLEESQVAGSLVVRPVRSSRRLVLIGGSQDTTVFAPSNVDLHPRPKVVVLSDGSSVAEEEHSPAVRVSMCQGGPGARCAGVAVPASVDDGISDTESVDSDPVRADVLEGSVASGDKEMEVPVGEMVRVRPSAASQRAGFVLLDHRDLGETFAQRGCLMRSVPRFLWGSFRVAVKVRKSWQEFPEGARSNK